MSSMTPLFSRVEGRLLPLERSKILAIRPLGAGCRDKDDSVKHDAKHGSWADTHVRLRSNRTCPSYPGWIL
jgi:hypothetical protein